MDFGESVQAAVQRQLEAVNARALLIANDLFNTVVSKTPVGKSPTQGTLINNWYVGLGIGNYNKSYSLSRDTSGSASYAEIASLVDTVEFVGKDGEISLTNSTPYGYRAEYFGWERPRWSGKITEGNSWAMIRNSLIEVAPKYK